MKISKLQGEDAIDVLAELLEPITEIACDKEFERLYKSKPLVFAAKHCLKHHKKSVLKILALVNCEDPDYFSPKFWELPKMLIDVLSDEDVKSLFISQQMSNLDDTSSVAVDNIKETERI